MQNMYNFVDEIWTLCVWQFKREDMQQTLSSFKLRNKILNHHLTFLPLLLIFLNILYFVWKQGHLHAGWTIFSDNLLVMAVSNFMELFIYAALLYCGELTLISSPHCTRDLSTEYNISNKTSLSNLKKRKNMKQWVLVP